MRTSDALSHYHTQTELAVACGVTPQAITYWIKKGIVPYANALELQDMTRGKLKVNHALYRRKRK
jgi:hypothetical protein